MKPKTEKKTHVRNFEAAASSEEAGGGVHNTETEWCRVAAFCMRRSES